MILISMDFEIIKKGQDIFKCPSELHLNVNHQNIIHSYISKHLIDCQPESDEKQELVKVIEAKLSV